MGMEDVESSYTGGGTTTIGAVTRFALGARGVDAVSRTTSSGTTVSYPLYDAHGNGVGSLAKSGSSWSIADEKSYDAWGGIRSGGTSDNKGRYCANLGHKQDDESGLVYMRARYYEATSGRFVSEDRACDGQNWFMYCANNPVDFSDESGNSPGLSLFWKLWAWAGGSIFVPLVGFEAIAESVVGRSILMSGVLLLVAWFFTPGHATSGKDTGQRTSLFACAALFSAVMTAFLMANNTRGTLAKDATAGIAAYMIVIATFMLLDDIEETTHSLGAYLESKDD